MGDGIPVHELDDDECSKVQNQTKSHIFNKSRRGSVAVVPVLSGITNSSIRKRLFMTRPGAASCRSRLVSDFAVCHAKEPLGRRLCNKLLEVLVLAALASCPGLRQRKKCRNTVFATLTPEGELGEF